MISPGTPAPQATRQQVRDQWDRIAAGFDELATPMNMRFADDVLHRAGVTDDTRFLDVAAGSGALAIPAARRGARVVATDISPVMLERLAARARAEGLEIETRTMDGQALELADDEFDVTGSQHGVSLFPDFGRGLQEMARVTRPGGRVVVVAFGALQRAEFMTFFLSALRAAVPDLPALDPPPLPFQVADPERLRAELLAAGLADVRVETDVRQTPVESAARLWNVVTNSHPIGGRLVGGLTADQVAAARAALEDMLRERRGAGDVATLRTEVNIGTGTS